MREKPNMNPEQELAATTRDQNIIVSAGAGSGKTFVLSERAVELIEEGIDISQLVILTFTNNSAFDMREKIRKDLINSGTYAHLADQVDSSYIMTFDAFALSIVKRFHYLLDIDKDISITDDSIVSAKKREFLRDILDNYYRNATPVFREFVSKYVIKNDNDIFNYILKIDQLSELKIDKENFFKTYLDTYFNEEKIKEDINELYKTLIDKIKDFITIVDKLEYAEDAYSISSSLKCLIDCLNYDDLAVKLSNYKFPRKLGAPSEDKEYDKYRNKIKDFFNNKIKIVVSIGSSQEIIDRYLSTKPYVSLLLGIVTELQSKMNEYKKEYSIYTFSDIARLGYELIDYPQVKLEFISNIKAVMVDEYQDTSDIQEAFLSKICHNNLFMVGDVKQSIYRFRNANYELFMDKYNLYYGKNPKDKMGCTIDLFRNYRSRPEVIEDINTMFSNLMTLQYGGANYRHQHITTASNTVYTTIGKTDQDYRIDINVYDKGNLKKEYYEAHLIAQDILSKLGKFKIVNKKDGASHLATYQDFTILIDRTSSFDVYKEVFEKYHIPLKIQRDEKISSSKAVVVMNSLLKLYSLFVNKMDEEVFPSYYASVYRSFIYQGDDLELENIILNKSFCNTDLYLKMKKVATECKDLPLSKQVFILLDEFKFEEKLILIGDVEENEKNVEYLLKTVSTMEQMGFTIDNYIDYLEKLDEYEIEIKSTFSDDGSNAVKLLTIHKSKGLEYPIVYCSGLSVEFNFRSINTIYMTSLDYGIILPVNDDKIPETIYHFLARFKERKEEISEKIRLFYVALTRAMEKIICYYPNDYQQSLLLSESTTMLDFLIYSNPDSSRFFEIQKGDEPNGNEGEHTSSYENKIIINQDVIIPFVKKEEVRASIGEVKDVDKNALEYGTNLHFLLEIIDFNNPNFEFIEDKNDLELIKKLFDSEIYQKYKNYKDYHEYCYYDEKNQYSGVIDLLLEGENEIIIVDFKTSNIDKKEYDNQLKTYAKYVREIFKKPIKAYLYSIKLGSTREVNLDE